MRGNCAQRVGLRLSLQLLVNIFQSIGEQETNQLHKPEGGDVHIGT
jgi:hypothetical protein